MSVKIIQPILDEKEEPFKMTETHFEILRILSETSDFCSNIEIPVSDKLNDIEHNAIKNIIACIAHAENKSYETVENIVASAFEVKSIKDISQKDYEQVVRFLVELNTKCVIN